MIRRSAAFLRSDDAGARFFDRSTGNKELGKDKTPPGLLRELLKDPGSADSGWYSFARPERSKRTSSQGPARLRRFVSRTAEWLRLPPAFPLNRLSATAVETYETCPCNSSWNGNGESRVTSPRRCNTVPPCTGSANVFRFCPAGAADD